MRVMVGMVDQCFHHTRILSLHHDAAGSIESRQAQDLKSKFMNFAALPRIGDFAL
ncbi:MAG: hypothetical protein K2X10_07785 [Hyphomicrobiales bacterium]|nr:hypothetical protein [Hyphomicrobiales bacterium]